MRENDFLTFLNHCDNDEILKMTEVCLTNEYLKGLVLTQPETVLSSIRKDFDLPTDYEIGEQIHRLNPFQLSDVLKKHISRSVLIEELNQINPDTKDALIKYKANKDRQNLVIKLKNVDKVFETVKSNYTKIVELNESLIQCNTSPPIESKYVEELHRTTLKSKIEELVLIEFTKNFDGKFEVKINGKKSSNKIPININIQDVNKSSIIFDFLVEKGKQDVKYNGGDLPNGNYFFLFWVGDFVGMPTSERFFLLTEYNIETISPLLNGFYVYDSSWWDGTKVCGVLDNSGFPLLAPQYTTIQAISSDVFQAYRINPNGELDENNQVIKEGWEYYNKKGKKISDEHGVEENEDEQKEKYYSALLAIWSEKELLDYKEAGIIKFSVWDLDFNHIIPFLKRFMNDPLVITRYPNIKHYLINDLYVCFDNQNNGKETFGLGIDPSLNIHFNYDEE